MEKYKVAYATGSRADYGIVRHYLYKLNRDEDIDLELLVTGALLSDEYGHQVDLIQNDGFLIGTQVQLSLDATNNANIIQSMSEALHAFGSFLKIINIIFSSY